MRRLKVFRVDSHDGEIHLIIKETQASENSECFADMAEKKSTSSPFSVGSEQADERKEQNTANQA
jgi:hypothetical protein